VGGVTFGTQHPNPSFQLYNESYYEYRNTLPWQGQGPHPSWYYEGGRGSGTVSCTVSVTAGGVHLGYASLSRQLEVFEPISTIETRRGENTVSDPDIAQTSDEEWAIASSYASGAAVRIIGTMKLPSIFVSAQGEGDWSYVQLVEREFKVWNGTRWLVVTHPWGLDNTYPYGGYVYFGNLALFTKWRTTAGKGLLDFVDGPGIGVGGEFEYEDDMSAECFMVLRPPTYFGQGRIDIPVLSQPWDYSSNSDRPVLLWRMLPAVSVPGGWEVTPYGVGVVFAGLRKPVFSEDMDWWHVNMNSG
jgi:hypothetical protein